MPGGRPKKKSRNTAGLRNQRRTLPSISERITSDIDESHTDHETEELAVVFDGLKIDYQQEYDEEVDSEDEEYVEAEIERLKMLDDVDFGRRLAEMVDKEDEKDADWIPRVLQQKLKGELQRD